MTTTWLKTSDGATLVIDEGESCNVTAVPKDMAGAAITESNLATLTATLVDEATGDVINGRDAQSVLDANGGTVASDGTLTLRLQPADAAIVTAGDAGTIEAHILRLAWTWSDGVLTRTGVQEWGLKVRRKAG